MKRSQAKVVAFVSGKGGVGKTMLAAAFAHELAQSQEVLLFDLDFFNRGLTGLLREGRAVSTVRRPEFIGPLPVESGPAGWELVRVEHNICHVRFPDLSGEEMAFPEKNTVQNLSTTIRAYLEYLAEMSGAALVVIDCHGGPDHLSFAACEAADVSILVSEPDKVTFYGTMHFLRQIQAATSPEIAKRLHLVFNKVAPAFSVRYLTRFYDSNVRKFFSGKPLLSVIPVEDYLTREFERTPFLTKVYPYSVFARKVRLLAYEVFRNDSPGLLPKGLRSISRLDRMFVRLSLAKVPAVLNTNISMGFATAAVMVFFLLAQMEDHALSVLRPLAYDARVLRVIGDLDSHKLSAESFCPGSGDSVAQAECVMRTCWPQTIVDYHYFSSPSRMRLNALCDSYSPSYLSTIDELKILEDAESAALDPRDVGSSDARVRAEAAHLRNEVHRAWWIRLVLLRSRGTETAGFLVAWFGLAQLVNWSLYLDRRFTYNFRSGRYLYIVPTVAVTLVVWSGYSFYYASVPDIWPKSRLLAMLGFLPLLATVFDQARKGGTEIWRERRRVQGAIRVAFVLAIVAQPVYTILVLYNELADLGLF